MVTLCKVTMLPEFVSTSGSFTMYWTIYSVAVEASRSRCKGSSILVEADEVDGRVGFLKTWNQP